MTVIKCHYLDNPKKDEGQTSGSGNVTEGHCWNSSCRKVKSFGSLRVRTYTPALRARYGTARPLLWNHSFFLVVSNNLTWRVFAWRKLGLKILWCLKLIETSSFTHTSNVSSHFRILEYSFCRIFELYFLFWNISNLPLGDACFKNWQRML